MFFRQIVHEEKSCLSYLIGCKSRGVMAVVDPQGDVERYVIRPSGMASRSLP